MSLPATIPPPSRSWKDIRQGVSTRAMSKGGRRRLAFASIKFVVLCIVGVGCVWTAFEVYDTWQRDPARLKEPVNATPLKQIVFATDGVLDQGWLSRTLALSRKTSLMMLDLPALERRLLASGQVQGVVLRRRFTDNSLLVTLQERTPVARLMVQIGSAPPAMRLVARDGVLYEGVGYDRATLDPLPWLDGVDLRRTAKSSFEPIEGMEQIAELLTAAQDLVPELRVGWQVVSLARLTSDQEILVRSREIPRVIFDARGDFPRQLAKLGYIVDYLRTRDSDPIEQVNLALADRGKNNSAVPGQVPVELQTPPARSLLPKPTSLSQLHRDF